MEDRHLVAEAGPEASDGLRRERDLRDEDDHAEAALERRPSGLQVHLGLSTPGGSVEQEVTAPFERFAEAGDRAFL